MTSGAFNHYPCVALQCDVAQVVIRVCAGKFRVRRAVAGGTLKSAVTKGKAIKRKTHRRCVCRSSEGRVHGQARRTIRVENGGVSNQAVVARGRSAVAILTIWLHEPAHSVGRTDGAHVAVAALALHFH